MTDREEAAAGSGATPRWGYSLDVVEPLLSVEQVEGTIPRGIRNNNPGNIEYGRFAQAYGATGPDANNRFAVFPNPEMGIAALIALQQVYEDDYGLRTVEQRINRWAPPFENEVTPYAQTVANAMRIPVDQEFSARDPWSMLPFVQGMVQHENGVMPYSVPTILLAYEMATNREATAPVPLPRENPGRGNLFTEPRVDAVFPGAAPPGSIKAYVAERRPQATPIGSQAVVPLPGAPVGVVPSPTIGTGYSFTHPMTAAGYVGRPPSAPAFLPTSEFAKDAPVRSKGLLDTAPSAPGGEPNWAGSAADLVEEASAKAQQAAEAAAEAAARNAAKQKAGLHAAAAAVAASKADAPVDTDDAGTWIAKRDAQAEADRKAKLAAMTTSAPSSGSAPKKK